MARGDGDSETFFANGDGRVVDGLYVDVVFVEEFVGGGFGKCCVADEDGKNV